jgi:hypothetical protein
LFIFGNISFGAAAVADHFLFAFHILIFIFNLGNQKVFLCFFLSLQIYFLLFETIMFVWCQVVHGISELIIQYNFIFC